jgi:hypothetical protein
MLLTSLALRHRLAGTAESVGTGPNLFLVYARMKSQTLGSAALIASCLCGGCTVRLDSQSQIGKEERRFTVKGTPVVRATTFDGSIHIQSWDKPEVLIEIEKRGPTREAVDALEVKSSQNGDTIEIEVPKPRTVSFQVVGMGISPTARLTVWVP